MAWPSKDPRDYAHHGNPEKTASVASQLLQSFFLIPGVAVAAALTDGWVTWLIGGLLAAGAAVVAVAGARRRRGSPAGAQR